MFRPPFALPPRAASGSDFSSRSARPNVAFAALIVLAHVLLVAAFMEYGGMPDRFKESSPASYIAFAFIAAPKPAQPAAAATAAATAPVPAIAPPPLRRAPPAVKPEPKVAPVFTAPEAPASEAPAEVQPQPAGAAPQQRIDMTSLRAAARQIDSERTPAQGETEQLRALEDSNLARAVRQAKRPDCQKKYSGGTAANVLLLIPLAIETITDKGCKW